MNAKVVVAAAIAGLGLMGWRALDLASLLEKKVEQLKAQQK